MKTAERTFPEKIYLQNREGDTYSEASLGEITWSEDIIDDSDVKYIRSDLVQQYADTAVEEYERRRSQVILNDIAQKIDANTPIRTGLSHNTLPKENPK